MTSLRREPSGMVAATARARSISAGSAGAASASRLAIRPAPGCGPVRRGWSRHGQGPLDQRSISGAAPASRSAIPVSARICAAVDRGWSRPRPGPGRSVPRSVWVGAGQLPGDTGQRLAASCGDGVGHGQGRSISAGSSGAAPASRSAIPASTWLRSRLSGMVLATVRARSIRLRSGPGRRRPAVRRYRPAPGCVPGRRGWYRPRSAPARSAPGRRGRHRQPLGDAGQRLVAAAVGDVLARPAPARSAPGRPGRRRPAARRCRPAPGCGARPGMVSATASARSISAGSAGAAPASRSAMPASAWLRCSSSGMVPATASARSISAGSAG